MKDLFHKLHLNAQSFLVRNDDGQGLTGYALAFTVIALGTVAGQSAIAQQVNHTFIAITSTLTTAVLQ
jgi:Flp pilus assembly pilin Flp